MKCDPIDLTPQISTELIRTYPTPAIIISPFWHHVRFLGTNTSPAFIIELLVDLQQTVFSWAP